MAKALAADARYIGDRVSRAQPLQLQNLTKDDATITLHFKEIRPVQVVYFQQDAYPNSPALLMSPEDDDLSGVLQSLNDQFEEYSLLTDVVKAVCSTLGYGADEAVLGEIAASQASDDENEFGGEAGSEDEEDQGNMWGMGENDDEELIKEVLQKSSRWKRLEDDRVAEEQQRKQRIEQAAAGPLRSADRVEQLSYLENMAKRNQIFNMNEAFQMLSKELSEMMQRLDLPWKLDAVQDDAYQWEVIFTKFAESSPLAQDLRELERLQGRGEVCLRLKFKRGLHPFFPPQVQLLRPRCLGPIAGALASHPMLQLSKWDPWRPQRDLLENLRTFLERVARVVVQSPLNSAHIPAAYTRLERLLAHLEALSGSLPACYEAHNDIYSARDAAVDELHLQAMAPMSKRAKTAKEGGDHTNKTWASGTGYGSGRGKSGEVWDARQAASAQDAQDAELRRVMSSLAAALGCDIPGPSLTTPDDTGLDAMSSDDPDEVGNEANDLSEAEMVSIVGSSCLIPVLESVLSCASFTDMSSRSKYYTDILRVAACLCHPRTAHLLQACQTPAASGGNQASFMQLLGNLEQQAQNFLSVLHSASRARAGNTRAAVAAAASTSSAPPPTQAQLDMEEEERCSKLLADLIVEVARRARASAPAPRPATRSTTAANTAGREPAGSSSEATQDAADAAYIETMRHLQLGFTASLATEKNHKYAKGAGSEGAQPRARMVRVGKEVAGLNMDLPLSPTSSVFVRVDEQNMTLWQALITGPANTPYENGCFVFDFYFPPTYPSVPPQVNLRTTGGGSVRFNPNLYNCGKVCLSLLGTWSGGQGEGWDAHSSSALQVLVSIQSLILVDEPYFNEPGFEATMHTPQGRQQNKRYNLNIREQTMHWAIWQQLRSPPLGFEEVVRSHFRLRKEQVLATCQAWVREAETDREASASRMKKFLNDIRSELAKL